MEPASRLIRGLRIPGDVMSAEQLACAAWPAAVGKKVAAHTRAVRMVRSRLVVEVEDAIWQRQLFALSRHILSNLERGLGPGLVEDLEFRVVHKEALRRREPQRAERAMPSGSFDDAAGIAPDDADGIADPVLRGIYKASRKKAQA
jgi:hypothetical protein